MISENKPNTDQAPPGNKRPVGKPAPARDGKLSRVDMTIDSRTRMILKQVGDGNVSAGVRILCAEHKIDEAESGTAKPKDKYQVGHPRDPSEEKLSQVALTLDARSKARLKQLGGGNRSAGLRILCAEYALQNPDMDSSSAGVAE